MVDVGVLEEAEALGFAGLFVVDEAEVEDGADAAEDVADLFFADACEGIMCGLVGVEGGLYFFARWGGRSRLTVGDVADEDDAAAFFAGLGHVVRAERRGWVGQVK